MFLEATELMSVSKCPLLHEVIPMIDVLDSALVDASKNLNTHPAIQAGAALGCAVLNRYYGKTDESILYRCAMCMFLSCDILWPL